MQLIDIAKKIDKSKNNECNIDSTDFSSEFNYNFEYVEPERLKCYWIGNWYCTDSWVGYRIYFLDDEPVAVSTQQGRKCSEEFEWFSRELALKVRDYLISIMPKSEEDLQFKLCDINEDIGEGYKISFNSQILNYDNAVLNGEAVKILERIRDTPDYGIDERLKIQLANGEKAIVNIRDLDFKFHTI